MKLTVEKTVTEEIEIAVPCYRKIGGRFYHVTETSVLDVGSCQITLWEKDNFGSTSFNNRVKSAFAGTEITESEFDEKYNEVIASFKVNNSLTIAV